MFPFFYYPVSPSLLTSHLITLSASGCSVNFCIFFLCASFPLFLFPLSCLPLRQPEYDNVISHRSTSPLFLPLLRLCLFVLSLYHLLTLLPSTSPCLSCSYFQSQTMHTHTPLDPTCRTLPTLFSPLPFSETCASFPPSAPSFIQLSHPSSALSLSFFHLFSSLLLITPPPTTFYLPEIVLPAPLHLPLPVIPIRKQISFATRAVQY